MENKNKISKLFNKLSDFLFFLSILIFTVGLNFQDTPPPNGWYQQFIPDVNNMPISDIEFLDSLVGFAVTGDNVGNDTNYILKTTNGGDNWFINFFTRRDFFRVIFINSNTGYVSGGYNAPGVLYKTTNQGSNWIQINTGFGLAYKDMSVLNEDTIWLADDNPIDGGVFRTTNGGQNWTQQFSGGGQNPDKIYMYNARIGFMGALYKTTNSGENWTLISGETFSDMYFIDSLTGWKVRGDLKKTTNGGFAWIKKNMPSDPHFWTGGEGLINKFSFVNNDTIWGVYDNYRFGPGNYRGIIWVTTNNGENWGYQIPDTSIHISRYYHVDFINKLNGWTYHTFQGGVHTVTGGGDTTYYMEMTPINTEMPGGYRLHQNYPNPFNYSTRIKFGISKTSDVKLKVYNLLGKEVDEIVNSKVSAGSYDYKFIGSELSSGVYLCRLVVDDNKIDIKKMVLIK